MTEKKTLNLHIPRTMFDVMKRVKDISGISYTNFIYSSLLWYMISNKLISLKDSKIIEDEINDRNG